MAARRAAWGLADWRLLGAGLFCVSFAAAVQGAEEAGSPPASPQPVALAAATQPTADTQPVALAPATQPVEGSPGTQPATQPAIASSIPVPVLPTTRPSTQPANGGVVSIGLAGGGGLILNCKDASVDAVLEQLSEVARFVVVKETKVEGRITLLSKQPVSHEEAIALLNTALKNNGYAAIQMGRILKIVPRDKAKKANIPVRTGSDPNKIDETDELITQVIPIRFADAVQLRQDLSPLISMDADLTANASSNTLIITDSAVNIRRIVEIISALDTHMADAAEVKVFQLEYANASNAARLVNDIFREEQQGGGRAMGGFPFGGRGSRGGGPGGFGMPGMPGMPGGSAGQGVRRQVRVNASSDDRTNTVVVSGPADTLKVVERVIKELDADPAAEQSVFIYNLKNGTAIKVEAVINNLFGFGGRGGFSGSSGYSGYRGGTSSGRMGSTGGFGSSAFGSRTGSSRSGGFGSSSAFGGSRSGGFGSGGVGSSSFGGSRSGATYGGSFGGRGRLSSGASRTAIDLSGQVAVVADEDTNSLLVMTAPKNFERVKEVLEELDRPVPQVLIKVLIAEVTHDNARDLGAEFSILNLRDNGLGTKVGTDFGIAAQQNGLVFSMLENNVTAAIRALESNGKLDVLSRPYILASDNQMASILVGSEVPRISNSRTTETGQTINTIQYDPIGIMLSVTPHINPEGLVIMDVAPEISSLTGTVVPVSETVSAPVFAKRSAQSRVSIRNGQTIVIGGLMEDRKTETVDKVPLAGDIPLLGALFQRKRTGKSKTELLIFLTPHVAADGKALSEVSKDEAKGTKLVPKAVEPGAFDEHMKALQGTPATQPAEENDEK